MGTEYLVLWLEVETQTTSIDEGCGRDFFLLGTASEFVVAKGAH
jgi:hypothetical protein